MLRAMDETRYLSAAEVAERLGISLRTARRRIADGTLPSVKIGGAVRVPASALGAPEGAPRTAARERIAPYAASAGVEADAQAEDIRRWNREHWPDTFERMLGRRRDAFAQLDGIRTKTRPPSAPQDTVDAMLRQEREEFGVRLLPFIPDLRETRG
jgi:excisionase family DNA binding protein